MAKKSSKASARAIQNAVKWVSSLDARRLATLNQLKVVIDDCERMDPPDKTAKVWVIGRNPKKSRKR